MKNIIIIFAAILLIGCSTLEVKNKNLIRPEYKFQKTYVLRQAVGDFINYFDVWENEPVDFSDYADIKEMDDARIFTVVEKITLVGNEYLITDKKNKVKYELKQKIGKDTHKDKTEYEIYLNNNMIVDIIQPDAMEKFDFNVLYNNKTYSLKGMIKGVNSDIHSFDFTILHNDDVMGTIFKEYSAMTNNYEVIINRQFKNIEDLAVFVHQILKEKGYQYK
jgi:hypothetical protein